MINVRYLSNGRMLKILPKTRDNPLRSSGELFRKLRRMHCIITWKSSCSEALWTPLRQTLMEGVISFYEDLEMLWTADYFSF